MLRHFFDAHKFSSPFRCEKCDKSYISKRYLRMHMKQHMSNRLQFECEECDRKYAFRNSLIDHVNLCHKGVTYYCDICGKSFTQKCSMTLHKEKHNPDYVPLVSPCTSCDKKFYTRSGLRRHVEVAHKNNVFVCSVCGKVFTSKWSLNEHMNLHQEIKQYACDMCDKRFTKKTAAKQHMMMHKKKELHKCKDCGKGFRRLPNLTLHLRKVHKNETPFECMVCRKRFISKGHLNRHTREVHVGKATDTSNKLY